jgi:hypothetical protein
MKTKGNGYTLLVRTLQGKKPLGRPQHRITEDIKMDLAEIGKGGVEKIGLAQDRDRWRANNVVLLDAAQCDSSKKRRFGGK